MSRMVQIALGAACFSPHGVGGRIDSHPFHRRKVYHKPVIHLWVEDFLELFSTIMVAYVFVVLGVVRERVALTIVYLDIVLYCAGGMIGTMHHVYFSGTPAVHMALGAFFSAAEVIPLTILTLESWSFVQLGSQQHVVGGVLPIVYLCWLGVRCQKPVKTTEAVEEILFTELVE
jgi:nitric oxide reductase subunit B